MNYYLHILLLIEIYIILVVSLNLQYGFSGLPNFAIGIFYGLGAYAYSLFSIKLGFNFLSALLIAFFINGIMSLFISLASMKFKREIFILVSIAFQIITYSVLWNWNGFSGGSNGISNIPNPSIGRINIDSNYEFVILGGLFVLLTIVIYKFIEKSSFGTILLAIKDNEISAKSLGFNPVIFKVTNVAIACAITSFSGVLFASYVGYIDTTSFSIHVSIDILFILILGGILSIRGVIVGTSLFFVIQEVFKHIGFGDSTSFSIRIILFSILILVIVFFKPKGLLGKVKLD